MGDHRRMSGVLVDYGDRLLAVGRIDAASQELRRALKIAEDIANDVAIADAQSGLARAVAAAGDLCGARVLARSALAVYEANDYAAAKVARRWLAVLAIRRGWRWLLRYATLPWRFV
jgi:hypothetical protein